MEPACPGLASDAKLKFLAPSLAGNPTLSNITASRIFADGLNQDDTVGYVSLHKYIAARGSPGITKQGTLRNHTNNIRAVNELLSIRASIEALPDRLVPDVPYILGEGNSLARQGIGGVCSSFGAALWGFHYALQLVSGGIGRWHMHQGTTYRYQAWQPIQTSNTTIGAKAPYYGNIATSAFLGKLDDAAARPQVVNLPLPNFYESAWASYVHGKLVKLAVINMQSYNASTGTSARPVETYSFQLPEGFERAGLQRLLANGSHAITGVTFDGFSYAAELDEGRPVRLNNVTSNEHVRIGRDGRLKVLVPRSSAVVLNLQ